ncbi:hypothetical protein D515_02540 [Grimontia indica]|uniref:Uncharacterized protein n=1 Tax=Grimontia indica TaxID=1056512 RepID=R1IVR7_9GAMM|nr:hypothetical protein D515_02540 [Grimontia indica]
MLEDDHRHITFNPLDESANAGFVGFSALRTISTGFLVHDHGTL